MTECEGITGVVPEKKKEGGEAELSSHNYRVVRLMKVKGVVQKEIKYQ